MQPGDELCGSGQMVDVTITEIRTFTLRREVVTIELASG